MRALFLYLFFVLPCFGVERYDPQLFDPMLEPWRFRHEEVLAGHGTLCMTEAAEGTLYFGGTEGLARYDGFQVVPIPYDDGLLAAIGTSKKQPWLKALLALEGGGVLAVVENSLVYWSGETWEVVILDAGPSIHICELVKGPEGAIWLILPAGLWRVSPDLEEVEKVVSGFESNVLSSFCFDEAGDLWFVKRLEDGTLALNRVPMNRGKPAGEPLWERFAIPSPKPMKYSSLARGQGGLIWYGDRSASSGLLAFDTVSKKWVQDGVGIAKIPIHSIITDRDGAVWGGLAGALCRIDTDGNGTVYGKRQLGFPQLPLSLYETSDRRLWVMGHIGYVYSIDLSFNQWLTYEGMNFQCETKQGVLWFVEKSGSAVSFDTRTGEWLEYGPDDGLINAPLVLIESSHGLIWAAGRHEGTAAIAVFDGDRWDRRIHDDFALRVEAGSAYEANDGTVWFGAGGRFPAGSEFKGGALRYEVLSDGEVRLKAHYSRPLFTYYALSFAETAEAFWVGGTTLQGYDKAFSKRLFSVLEPKNSIVDLLVDKDDSLWLGRVHLGIFQRKGGVYRKFTDKDGVESQLLADLKLLGDGSILASSDKGISRFDGEKWSVQAYLKDFAMSKSRSEIRESPDGALWFNFDGAELPAGQDADALGRDAFRVTRHRPESIPPRTRIVEYMERVAQPGNAHIEWQAHDLWGGTPEERIQYSWRLNGGPWSAFSYSTGHTFLDLDHGRHALEVRARDEAFNVDPTPDRIEFAVIPPVWMQPWFVAMLTSFVGMILALIWIIIKTREKHLQAVVKEQEARERHLVDTDRLKTGFFTNISHELRTPLTVILAPLQRMMDKEVDPEKREMMTMMERNARRVLALISQLLDLRNLEESKMGINAVEGDLGVFLKEVVTSLTPLAEEGEVHCQLAVLPVCRGWYDPDKFQKIVTNLLANAIKYTPAGGAVRVELEVEVAEDSCRWAKLVIEDTGSGIDPEHCSRIFDRFYRIPESNKIDGSGIGLNLTYELVALWEGTIDLKSPVQDGSDHPGSRFTVRLPIDRDGLPQDSTVAHPSEAIEPRVAADEPAELSPAKASTDLDDMPLILVAEDDDDIRGFIAESLGANFRVEVAVDGKDGWEKARELVPDLVITDLMMPNKSGLELCHLLKTDMATCHIPVIMLTAKASIDSQVAGLDTGADDYVTKPFHSVLLQTRIRNLLESRRKLRALFSKQWVDAMDPAGDESPTAAKASENPDSVSVSGSAVTDSLDQEFMERVGAILRKEAYDPEFTIEVLSQALNMSPRTARRKIKALTGRSPVSLIIELRLKKAAELLEEGSLPVTEIVYETGFGDYGNFFRQFRKEFDMSPSDYRDQVRKG